MTYENPLTRNQKSPPPPLDVHPRSDLLRTPTINYRADYQARLGIARQQAAPETKTVNSRPKSEREDILPRTEMVYENPLTRCRK